MIRNKLNLLHGLLFITIAAIILQLDAYFYLLGLYSIKPWNIVFFVFLLFGIRQAATRRLPSWKDLSAQHEVLFLIFCVFVYVLVQLIGISSWVKSPDEIIIYWFWVYMLVLVFLGLMTGYELKEKRTDFFLLVLIIHTLILLVDYIFGGISDTSAWARASGTLRNPNNASFLAVALMAGSIRWDRENPGIKEALALVLTIASLGLTGSRGGAVSLFVLLGVMLFWWVSKSNIRQRKMQRAFIAATLVSLVMGVTILTIYEMRYVKRANLKAPENSSLVNTEVVQNPSFADVMDPNDRDRAKDIALQLMKAHPWLGHGTGYVYIQQVGPHNMLLRALVEVGVLGLLGYLMLPAGLLYVSRQRHDWGLAALTLCGLTVGLMSHNLTENRSYLVILGIMLWINNSRRSS